jgi:hypothetical protein
MWPLTVGDAADADADGAAADGVDGAEVDVDDVDVDPWDDVDVDPVEDPDEPQPTTNAPAATATRMRRIRLAPPLRHWST